MMKQQREKKKNKENRSSEPTLSATSDNEDPRQMGQPASGHPKATHNYRGMRLVATE